MAATSLTALKPKLKMGANIGKIPIRRDAGRWSMVPNEVPPTGKDYREFLTALEGFVAGYFSALGIAAPVYCQGDFFGERTEAIHITEPNQLPDRFFEDLSHWLAIPRWDRWRIVLPAEGGDSVIYAFKVVRS
ncbi:MAG: hypothetical protein R3F11_14845 [Verrucomicrobiales bacterium]